MIADMIPAIWWFAAGLTAAAIAYLLLALAVTAAYRPRFGPGWPHPPEVAMFKPMYGLEDGLEEAVASCLAQEVDCSIRYVFGVHHADDPALELARRVAARFPDRKAEFVVDGTVHGLNPKVTNLVNIARAGGLSEIVVLTDSDTFMAPGELQEAIDALSAPGVGAATALYRARPGIPDEPVRMFGAWFLDYWFLPMAALHARLGPLGVTYAPVTAIRRDVLDEIGGLKVLADEFADDNALGRLVRQAGYEVVFTPRTAETLANDATLRDLFTHELRWSRTVRGLDPIGFVASVVTHSGPIPLLLLLRPSWIAAVGIVLPVLLRWLLARLVVRRFGRAGGLKTPGPVGLWLRDQLNFAVWLSAFFVSHVDWRGQRIALDGSHRNRRPKQEAAG